MKNKIFIKTKDLIIKHRYILICIMLCLYIVYPMKNYFTNGDDFLFHILNIKYASRVPIFGKIIPGIEYNFGSGVGIFYPPLVHKFAAVIYIILMPIEQTGLLAFKITKVIMLFAIIISMYITTKTIYKDKRKAMFASLFYVSSSYLYVDMYTREAINETALFIFIPLIFLSFYYIFKENNRNKFMLYFIIGYTGMIYSHLVMTVFFTLLLIPFLLFYIKDIFKKENLLAFIYSTFIVLILTSTFTVPLIEHMSLGLWHIPNKGNAVFPFVEYIFQELHPTGYYGYLYVNILNIVIVLCLVSIYRLIKKEKDKNRKFNLALATFTGVTLLFCSSTLFWRNPPQFFQTIQFAWRLAVCVTFGTSLLAIYSIDKMDKIFVKKYRYIGTIVIIFLTFSFTYSHYKITKFYTEINYNEDSVYTYPITDYLPINTMLHMDYLEKRDTYEIIGDASLYIYESKNPNLKFKVSNVEDKTKLELPRLYYLGYSITDDNGNNIKYKEDKYGFITINVPNGTYTVKYKGTTLYKIAVFIKTISIIVLLFIGIRKKKIYNSFFYCL